MLRNGIECTCSFIFVDRIQIWGHKELTHWSRDKMVATLADDTFKYKFVYENVLILIKISLRFVPNGPINNIPSLVQIMAWPDHATSHYLNQWWYSLLTHLCVHAASLCCSPVAVVGLPGCILYQQCLLQHHQGSLRAARLWLWGQKNSRVFLIWVRSRNWGCLITIFVGPMFTAFVSILGQHGSAIFNP